MVNKGNPQEWLKNNTKNNETEIKTNFRDEFDKGELEIKDYSILKIIRLKGTKGITKLTINNCLDVEEIEVYDNAITEIVGLENLSKLRRLNCGANAMTKIDISKNTNLEVLLVHDKNTGMQVVGIENISKLVTYSGGDNSSTGISLNLVQISQEGWKGAAQKLDIDINGKNAEEIRNLIEERGKRDRENEQKLNDTATGLPGLLSTSSTPKGAVDDNELKKINDKLKEINEVHNVTDHPNNAKILDSDKFSQAKLDELIGKGNDYDDVVKKNPELVDNNKISQGKIDGLKDANKDAAAAITRLGVTDLKIPTLDAKLGDGTNLSHIPTTLKDLLAENKKLEDALNKVGIDPKGNDTEQQLEKLKKDSQELEITKEFVKGEIGAEAWSKLEAQVLVEVNHK